MIDIVIIGTYDGNINVYFELPLPSEIQDKPLPCHEG